MLGGAGCGEGGNAAMQGGEGAGEPLLLTAPLGATVTILFTAGHQLLGPGDQGQRLQPVVMALRRHLVRYRVEQGNL